MKTLKNKFPTTAIILLLITILISSCSSDDGPQQEPIPELEALVLDCSPSGVAAGETLTLENRNNGIDYIIDCVFVVNGDFIIEDGVTIQFNTDAGIRVDDTGSLQVLGLQNNQVVFKGEDSSPGAWRGVFFYSNDVKNKIEYAKVEHAGGLGFNSNQDRGGVIVYSGGRLNMNNTTITNSETYGFNASYGGCELMLHNNTITNCIAPMYILGTYITTISEGSYTGNNLDAIVADRSFIANESHHTWTKLNVPYHFPEGMDVTNSGGKLTILPGVIMKFGQDTDLSITEGASGNKPSLIAVGTASEPIVFTSIDEVMSGWRGIYFDSPNALNEIGFATIENASNPSQNGAIYIWAGTVLNVHDVLFKDITNCAIQTFSNAGTSLTTSNLTFDNVGTQGVCED